MKKLFEVTLVGLFLFWSAACAAPGNAPTNATTADVPAASSGLMVSAEYAPGAITTGQTPNFSNSSQQTVRINADPIEAFLNILWGGAPRQLPQMILLQDSGSFSVSDVGCSIVLVDANEAIKQIYACFMTYRLNETGQDGYQNSSYYANELARTFLLAANGTIENPPILAERNDWLTIYMPLQEIAPTFQSPPIDILP